MKYQVIGNKLTGEEEVLSEADTYKQAWIDFATHSKEQLRNPSSPYKAITLRKVL